jgi:hypothetical protein
MRRLSLALLAVPLVVLAVWSTPASAAPSPAPHCTFASGVTTCVTTVVTQEQSTHQEFSGCFAGPTGVPGSRVRTFQDTYEVTTTTVTKRHGLNGALFFQDASTSRRLVLSVLLSDVCTPI